MEARYYLARFSLQCDFFSDRLPTPVYFCLIFQRFSQYLASNNCQLSSPRSFERSNSQGNFIIPVLHYCPIFCAYDLILIFSSLAATMFLFIRHYARYLDARSASYREVAFDFCRIRRK